MNTNLHAAPVTEHASEFEVSDKKTEVRELETKKPEANNVETTNPEVHEVEPKKADP